VAVVFTVEMEGTGGGRGGGGGGVITGMVITITDGHDMGTDAMPIGIILFGSHVVLERVLSFVLATEPFGVVPHGYYVMRWD
jgi:hypothetical protein